jgi:hypothetical protein
VSESTRAVVCSGARAVDAVPPRLRRSVRFALGRPGLRPVAFDELDAVPGAHCGAKKRGSVPLGTLAPFVRASCRWPRSTQ